MSQETEKKFPNFKSDIRNLIMKHSKKFVIDLIGEDVDVEVELSKVVNEYFGKDLINEYYCSPREQRTMCQEKNTTTIWNKRLPYSSTVLGDYICYDFDSSSRDTPILFYKESKLVCMRFDVTINPFGAEVSIVYVV